MKKQIETEVRINAGPQAVWAVLADFGRYPEWNPFLRWLEGDVREGGRIRVRVVPTGGKGMTFAPTVLSFVERREIAWLGSLGPRGLFDGEHRLALTDNGDGTTTFSQSEHFSGILVRLFDTGATASGFAAMYQALKERSEADAC
jgi:hypothetical protein